LEAFLKEGKELPLEQRRHDPDRDEEPFAAGDPAASVGGESTPGDNTMDVRMIHEVLSPGVQDADAPDLCTEMFRVVCEFRKCLGDGAEKKIVQDPAIHRYQGLEFRGEGEDHMEIRDRQEVLTSGLDPFFFP